MVIKAIAEPAAARCRPALPVRRMGLLKIAKARPCGVTRAVARAWGGSDRQMVTRSLSPGRVRAAFGNGVGRTLRQHYPDWPDLAGASPREMVSDNPARNRRSAATVLRVISARNSIGDHLGLTAAPFDTWRGRTRRGDVL